MTKPDTTITKEKLLALIIDKNNKFALTVAARNAKIDTTDPEAVWAKDVTIDFAQRDFNMADAVCREAQRRYVAEHPDPEVLRAQAVATVAASVAKVA